MVNSIEIEYLTPKSEYKIGGVKNIAIPNNNKDDIKKVYDLKKGNMVSNADMLTQSFSQTPVVEPKVEPVIATETVQISAIPTGQTNLESTPVNLNTETPTNSFPEISTIPEIKSVPEMAVIEPIPNANEIANNSNVELVVPQVNAGIESDYKVSNQPNIFDNPTVPFSISQEDINKPLESGSLNPIESVQEEKTVPFSTAQSHETITNTDISEDIIQGQIAIEESNIKHYEALAENSRKKVELLKRQIKKEQSDINLENTASNLFNNNGVLDEEKVLGKTPMPNIKVA